LRASVDAPICRIHQLSISGLGNPGRVREVVGPRPIGSDGPTEERPRNVRTPGAGRGRGLRGSLRCRRAGGGVSVACTGCTSCGTHNPTGCVDASTGIRFHVLRIETTGTLVSSRGEYLPSDRGLCSKGGPPVSSSLPSPCS